jgi:Tol biopolymer transport system component
VLTWTPDQRYLVFADDAGTLWRVPVNGGEPERIGVSMDGSIPPQVQPDGRGLYFTMRGDSSPAELWVLENFLPGPSAR